MKDSTALADTVKPQSARPAKSKQSKPTKASQPPFKPKKPYPAFPLCPHPAGKWQKKIKGKICYFGRWGKVVNGKMERIPGDGWKEALALYKEQADELHAGRKPVPVSKDLEAVTVQYLCNAFLTEKSNRMKNGELTARSFVEYRSAAGLMVECFGKKMKVDDLRPNDFSKLRSKMAENWGLVRLGKFIQFVRTICKYGYDSDLIDRPIRFGTQFDRPKRAAIRIQKHEKGEQLFSIDEIRDLIDNASSQVRAMILLGINCAFGNSDVARLKKRDVNLDAAWIKFPRPKTGTFRECPLWPETVEALKTIKRPLPLDKADDGLMFITKYGTRWVRTNGEKHTPIDAVSGEFGKLLRKLDTTGRVGLGFYTLRHTFRTIADATKDNPAIRLIMGHTDGSIDATYRERIDEDRLLAVTEHVRSWLFFSKHDEHVRAWKRLNKRAGGVQ